MTDGRVRKLPPLALDAYLDADSFRAAFASANRQNEPMARSVRFKVKREGGSWFAVLVTGFSAQEMTSPPMATKGDAFAVVETVWQHLHEVPDGPIGYTPDSLLPD